MVEVSARSHCVLSGFATCSLACNVCTLLRSCSKQETAYAGMCSQREESTDDEAAVEYVGEFHLVGYCSA